MRLMELFERDLIRVTGRDIAVLDAIRQNGPTCAADALLAIEEVTKKTPRLATVYDTILDLHERKLIQTTGLSPGLKGGRPRRLYVVSDTGRMVLDLAERMLERRS